MNDPEIQVIVKDPWIQ